MRIQYAALSPAVPVIVAADTLGLARDAPRRCERQVALLLELVQQVLVADALVVVLHGALTPLRHEGGDLRVTALQEPLHGDVDAATREHLVLAMPAASRHTHIVFYAFDSSMRHIYIVIVMTGCVADK